MLAAIGVSSVDDLFEQVPAGVRFGRELDGRPALTEAELVRHLEELAARNAHTGRRAVVPRRGHVRPLRPRRRRRDPLARRVPDRLHAVPAGDEPGRAAGDLRVPDRDLRAHGMDVSNASGYDGTTVAADACFVARHATGRTKVVARRGAQPPGAPGREDLRARLRARGRRGAAPRGSDRPRRARGGRPRMPRACSSSSRTSSACSRTPPELAAAASDAGALAIAHVDPASLGVLEAPGDYGCALAIGEGQGAGNYLSYGGPHYGFLAARSEFIRRMPGRIVGETVDAAGKRGYVLTLQTREQHIRREKATSNMTTNQTLLALAGLVTLCWLGPQGLRELGETCIALAELREGRLRCGLPSSCFRTGNVQGVCRPARTARARRDPRCACARGVHPGYALGRDYEGWTTSCSSRSPRSARRRTSTGSRDAARSGGLELTQVELIYEKSRPGRRAGRVPASRPAGGRAAGGAPPRDAAAAARGHRARARAPLHGARRPQLRHRHRLLPARLLHDEAQPARQRARRRAARASATCIRSRRTRARRARSS